MKKTLCLILALAMVFSLAAVSASADGAQEITYSLYSQPDGIDPGITNNSFASDILANAFEGLMTYDTETGSLICGEAESYTVSDDGLVYTFTLRDGLKWSDGSDHTAADYVYAIKRILTPATGAQYVDLVATYIAGAAEYYAGETDDFDTVGIKALDDRTLEITLYNPTSFFADILTMWTFDPVQEATIEANGDQWTSSPATYISNGPFYVTDMKLGESITLSKNPYYYDADKVQLDKVTFRYITDNATALMAYEAGEIDGMNVVPASDYARLKANDDGFIMTPSYGTTYWDFNCSVAPFDNVLVRKAFNLAIDRYTLINDVLQTDADPAYSFIAPGYVVDGVDYTDDRSDFGLSDEADVEAAQEALAEAGYPNGEGFPEITYSTNDSGYHKAVAEYLQQAWGELGLTVKVDIVEWASFTPMRRNGEYEAARNGWVGDYDDPSNMLELLETGNGNNDGKYSNPEFDAAMKASRETTDLAERSAALHKAEDILMEDAGCIPVAYYNDFWLQNAKIDGMWHSPYGYWYFMYADIAE